MRFKGVGEILRENFSEYLVGIGFYRIYIALVRGMFYVKYLCKRNLLAFFDLKLKYVILRVYLFTIYLVIKTAPEYNGEFFCKCLYREIAGVIMLAELANPEMFFSAFA